MPSASPLEATASSHPQRPGIVCLQTRRHKGLRARSRIPPLPGPLHCSESGPGLHHGCRLFPYSPIFRLTSRSSSKILRASASRPSFRSSTARDRSRSNRFFILSRAQKRFTAVGRACPISSKASLKFFAKYARMPGTDLSGSQSNSHRSRDSNGGRAPDCQCSNGLCHRRRHSCNRCNEPPGAVASDRGS